MPPRFAYWTILVGGLPTAFRAAERDEIEPTFRRLKQKHPDAEMRWFARGKLWASPAEASEALSRQKAEGTRPKDGFGERRGREWRPGGSHRDPRQGYIDAKKRENQRKRERRFEFKQGSRPQAPGSRAQDESRQKAKGEGQKEEPRRWERPGPKWGPPRQDRRPETGDRRPPKTDDRRPTTESTLEPQARVEAEAVATPGAWSPQPGVARPRPETGDRRPQPKTEDQRPRRGGPRPAGRATSRGKGPSLAQKGPRVAGTVEAPAIEDHRSRRPSPKPMEPWTKAVVETEAEAMARPGARSPQPGVAGPETGDRRPTTTEDRRPKTEDRFRPWSPKPPGSGQPRGRWAGKGHGPRGPKR